LTSNQRWYRLQTMTREHTISSPPVYKLQTSRYTFTHVRS